MSGFTEEELRVGVGAYDKLLAAEDHLDDEWTEARPESARELINEVLEANEPDHD